MKLKYKKKIALFIVVIFLGILPDLNFQIENIQSKQEYKIKFLNQTNNDSWIREWNKRTYGKFIDIDSEENIIVGCSEANGFSLVKYNSSGSELWSLYYGCWTYWWTAMLFDILIDSNDNIYTIGFRIGETVGWDHFLLKFNSSGGLEWELILDEIGWGAKLACDSFNNIYSIVNSYGGYGDNGLTLRKYNSSGYELWSRGWGGVYDGGGTAMVTDSLDNLYVLGITNNTVKGDYDIFLLKYNNTGHLLWNRTWGSNSQEYGMELLLDSSDQINILGRREHLNNTHTLLLSYNTSGIFLWNQTFYNSFFLDFSLDSSDNYYLIRNDEYYINDQSDIYLAKYNNSRKFEWDLVWGENFEDVCRDITIDSLDNIYLTGYTRDMMILVKNPIDKSPYSPPGIFTLKSNTTNTNNVFNLIWTDSRGAENYSIYTNNDYFREINNSSSLVIEGILDNNYSISGLQNGVYFYIVSAYNQNGCTDSNCIYVVVSKQNVGDENRALEFYILIVIFIGIGIIYVVSFTILYRKFFLKTR